MAPDATDGWQAVPAFPHLIFKDPVFLVPEPRSNRLTVGSLWGIVHRFVNDPDVTSMAVFLDIRDRTKASLEGAGLLNLAFHPQFGNPSSPHRGYVYAWYVYSPNPADSGSPLFNRLSRFTVPAGAAAADPGSELVLIEQYDPNPWHNGGGLHFGSDGFLYLSVGDGGGANDTYNNAQRINFGFFSGVLRIDVDQDLSRSHPIRRQPQSANPAWPSSSGNYTIPNDNPFLDPAGGVLEEFWAIGLRNPHRMSHDPATGQLWVGDVGEAAREEINVIERGGNYQWSHREGTANGPKPVPPALIGTSQPPLFEYFHVDGNNCIIGGHVYRGTAFADLIEGRYVFGDNGSGSVWSMTWGGGGPPQINQLFTVPPFALSSFGVDQNNELYLCLLGETGGIYTLVRAPDATLNPPALLSGTGAFTNTATLTPAPGLVPYEVNSPLWSDGAEKSRWIAVPSDGAPYGINETVGFSPDGEWAFPNGTVFVKHFELPIDDRNPTLTRRLETRLLVTAADGSLYGLTYKWREDQTDADLLPGSLRETVSIATETGIRTQEWDYPSRQACLTCHSDNAGRILGVTTRQLNKIVTYPESGVTDNQLRAWNHIGLLNPAIDENAIDDLDQLVAVTDSTASLDHRVRSYLDANCAQCHRPGSGVRAYFDARYDTPLNEQGIINGLVGNGLGVTDARVVAPQDLSRSILHLRMASAGAHRMPPLASNRVDAAAVSTLEEWIAQLLTPQSLPEFWINGDVGSVDVTGSASFSDGAFTIRGAGEDIWGSADGFHFVHRPWSGDGEIVAKVASIENTDPWAKAGVMFREALTPGARHALMLITPQQASSFQRRVSAGGVSASTSGPYSPGAAWVKLVRSGSSFTGYHSANGINWTLVGSAVIDLPSTIHVGLAVTSHRNGTLCAATFDSVELHGSGAVDPVPAAPSNLMIAAASDGRVDLSWIDRSDNEDGFAVERSSNGASFAVLGSVAANVEVFSDPGATAPPYFYRVRATHAAGDSEPSNTVSTVATGTSWTSIDIGAVALPGGSTEDGEAFEVRGSGADIWGNADAFQFTHQSLTGDGSIFAGVVSVDPTDPWAKAGVMLRESLSPGARSIMMFVTPGNNAGLQVRATTGGSTTSTLAGYNWLPTWLLLTRTGDVFSGYTSRDGVNWSLTGSVTLDLPDTVLAGLAVTSHRNGVLCTATFEEVGLMQTGTPPDEPLQAPSGLSASANSANAIGLNWTDHSTNETGFEIRRSTDGVSFLLIGSVGAGATSHVDAGLQPESTYHYRVRAVNGSDSSADSATASATTPAISIPPPDPPDPPPPEPTGWTSGDIGSVGVAGTSNHAEGDHIIEGSGSDIWSTADAFHFVHQEWTGDGEIVARVMGLENTNPWAKAGVMFRESLSPSARHAFVCLTPANGPGFQTRSTAAGGSAFNAGPWGVKIPYWIKLVRSGNLFTGYSSPDGISWVQTGSQTIILPEAIHVGLAVTSHHNSTAATTIFEQVRVTPVP